MHAETAQPMDGELLEQLPAHAPQQALAVTDNPYMAMAQMAMQQGKVAEMRELMAMHKEWDAHQAFKAYVDAMAAFKTEPMEILKRKLVAFNDVSYKHAELSDVTAVVVPALGKHGLSHRWDVKQDNGQITVTCILTHRLGHSESVTLSAAPDGSGKKNAIQQVASTVTYLERYTLLMATGMATTGMDDDGRASEKEMAEAEFISVEQEATLRDLIEANVKNPPKFLAWLKIEKLSDLLAANYQIAFNQLKQIEKERNGGARA
jgi:hypothetical protein